MTKQNTHHNKIRIGTRDSFLAMHQARLVQDAMHAVSPEYQIDIIPMKSSGDKILDKPLADFGGKGLFCKELDKALMDGHIDIAVHSLKDVETFLPDGMTLLAYLPREDVRDVLVSPNYQTLDDLPESAVVGTASLRRKSQLLHYRPDLKIKLIRGNVRTRLKKLNSPLENGGGYDATLLAMAGLIRTGLANQATQIFDVEDFVPACGQGALAVQCYQTLAPELRDKIAKINCPATQRVVEAERQILAILDGTCHTPIGVHVSVMDEDTGLIRVDAFVGAEDGSFLERVTEVCSKDDLEKTANKVAHQLRDIVGDDFFNQ